MYNLARCYKYELGTKKNLEEAIFWYKQAAEKGHIKA